MIRSILEPDIDEIQETFQITSASGAWTRLQIKLYRYSDLLEHLQTLPNLTEEMKRYLAYEEYDLKESR